MGAGKLAMPRLSLRVEPGADAGAQRRLEAFQHALDARRGLVVDATLQGRVGGVADRAALVAQIGQPLAQLVTPRFELGQCGLERDAQLERRLAAAARPTTSPR